LKIQNGGGRHIENHRNRDMSATVLQIFTKFGMVVQPLKNPRWQTSAIMKTVKSPYLQPLDRFL